MSWSCRTAACVELARFKPRGSKRRGGAVQTRLRGGCSGGGWPRPSGRASLRWSPIVSDRIGNGCEIVGDVAGNPTDPQAAMKTHLSQSTGAGAFDGQHGMSFAISSIVAEADASGIASIDMSEDISAMAGRETGAKASPAIKRIASNRRMAKLRFTDLYSHTLAATQAHRLYATGVPTGRIDQYQAAGEYTGADYLSDRPITAISSDIFAR